MAVIYGRRRVGKSTLITEFLKDKKSIYFVATKVSPKRNLELLTREVTGVLAPAFQGAQFSHPEDLFDLITNMMGDEKLVFVIDELPFWADKQESLLSVLQKYADVDWKEKNLFLILCGSALSFMEDKVLSEKSPLFGRRSLQIHLKEFGYREAALFTKNYNVQEKALCYGLTGGVAKYLSLFDDERTLDENIIRLFFDKDGYLYDETRNLLSQEFSDISNVSSIVEQIALGESTPRLIADKVGERESTVLYFLDKLMHVGIVEKQCCITEKKNRKKQKYRLRDSMFRFWYAFMPAAESAVAMGFGAEYYKRAVIPKLHEFMGSVFEDMCREFTLQQGLAGQLDCFVTETGAWWGNVPAKDKSSGRRYEPADVDVVAISKTDGKMILGECKFRNEKISKHVYDTLTARAPYVKSSYPVAGFVLFSLSGYTEWYKTDCPADVKCFTLDDLYS